MIDASIYKLTNKGKLGTIAPVIGVIGLALSLFGYFEDSYRFYHFYLMSYMFWLYVALGALFFTLLHHIAGATWSTVLRRLSESIMMNLPIMAIFALPVILGIHDLFHWSHPDLVASDPILVKKAAYLNVTFFNIRLAFYFLVWSALSISLYRLSKKQDEQPGLNITAKARRIGAPGMIIFALTLTFASFDLLMSLDPHWFSTIFGVYLWSGSFLAFLSIAVLTIVYQQRQGALKGVVTVEHYHDLGKFMFAFVIFWSYMAFSQYFLIWYANVPEETYWFLKRWEGIWKTFSLILIFGHFAFPFLALLTRGSKRSIPWMVFMSLWILAMRFVDIFWLVGPGMKDSGGDFVFIDFVTMAGTFFGIGGIFVWLFWRRYTSGYLVPVNDPTLKESIEFINN